MLNFEHQDFFVGIDCAGDKEGEITLFLKEIESDLSKICNKQY